MNTLNNPHLIYTLTPPKRTEKEKVRDQYVQSIMELLGDGEWKDKDWKAAEELVKEMKK